MFDRFTDCARKTIALAQKESERYRHDHIGTEHLLLALAKVGDPKVDEVLAVMGIGYGQVSAAVDRLVTPGSSVHQGPTPFTPQAKRALVHAVEEANGHGSSPVEPIHLLAAFTRESDSRAITALLDCGWVVEAAAKRLAQLCGPPIEQPATARRQPNIIDSLRLQIDALVRLGERKGLWTRAEAEEELRQVREQYEKGSQQG
jgi:ATP-dependent Clp protease ATP-binding subunit ClpC